MSNALSKRSPGLDGSSMGFRAAASDIGEVISLLRGGVQPDADTLSRLCLSLNDVRGFLVLEAEGQRCREQIAETIPFGHARFFTSLNPVSLPAPMQEVAHVRV